MLTPTPTTMTMATATATAAPATNGDDDDSSHDTNIDYAMLLRNDNNDDDDDDDDSNFKGGTHKKKRPMSALRSSPTKRVATPVRIQTLYDLVWRRVCVQPRYYSQVVHSPRVGTMIDRGQVTQRYIVSPLLCTGTLELLLTATLTHLAQLGTTPVSTYIRVEAQQVLLALLSLAPKRLLSLALHVNTTTTLMPLLNMCQHVPPIRVLNALLRAVRFVYCQEMVTLELIDAVNMSQLVAHTPSCFIHGLASRSSSTMPNYCPLTEAYCGTTTRAIGPRVPIVNADNNNTATAAAANQSILVSHAIHPFLNRKHPVKWMTYHLANPLMDMRLLQCNFFHDRALDGFPHLPHAKASAIALVHYPDCETVHFNELARYRGVWLDDASMLSPHAYDSSRPVYSSDHWLAVHNAMREPVDTYTAERLTPEMRDYLSNHHRALLWMRIMPDEQLYALDAVGTPLTGGVGSSDASVIFAGDLRHENDIVDPNERRRFITHRAYAQWFIALFNQVLALCIDSGQPFGPLGERSTHVLYSAGGQVLDAHTRFEQALFMAVQCFEQEGVVASLFGLASSCVACTLHAATQQPAYAPSMVATQCEIKPWLLNVPLPPPPRCGEWFHENYENALLHARANDSMQTHPRPVSFLMLAQRCFENNNDNDDDDNQHPSLPPPPPPHLHVVIALAESMYAATMLYQTPQYCAAHANSSSSSSSGGGVAYNKEDDNNGVRSLRLELDLKTWRSLIPLMPEPMAIATAYACGLVSTTTTNN